MNRSIGAYYVSTNHTTLNDLKCAQRRGNLGKESERCFQQSVRHKDSVVKEWVEKKASVIQNTCEWERDKQQLSRVLGRGEKWEEGNWSITFSIVGMSRLAYC